MKFSIITVVFNDVKNIEKTILSVKKQSYKNREHIIIDGNSSDGTSKVIKKYFKYVRHYRKKDKSLYQAINRGLEKVKGDIIFLIHSGDIFSNHNILKRVNKIFKYNSDVVSGNVTYYDDKKKSIVRNWNSKINDFNIKNFFKVPHTSVFIKKNIMRKLSKYSLKYNISSDLDFMIRLSKLKKKFSYLNENIIFMKTGGLSTSKKKIFIKILEDFRILFKYFGIFFFIIYLKKIFFKVPGFFFLKKINEKKLNNILNFK